MNCLCIYEEHVATIQLLESGRLLLETLKEAVVPLRAEKWSDRTPNGEQSWCFSVLALVGALCWRLVQTIGVRLWGGWLSGASQAAELWARTSNGTDSAFSAIEGHLRIVATCVLLTMACCVPAEAHELFSAIRGVWVGPGRIEFKETGAEALRCKAYYISQTNSDRLNVAIHCSSTSYKIELRAQLAAIGDSLSGTWEERSFNANGTVTGQIQRQRISLSIEGGGFTGGMMVAQAHESQVVSIVTEGIGFKKIDLSLKRGNADDRVLPLTKRAN